MKPKFGQWHFRLYPELARFANDDERAEAFKAFGKGSVFRRPLWLGLLAGVSNLAVVKLVPRGWSRVLPYALEGWIVPVLFGICLGLGFSHLWRRPLRQHLRRWLVDRGVPICLGCGYDLSGQIEPRCPECGESCDPGLIVGQGPDQRQ